MNEVNDIEVKELVDAADKLVDAGESITIAKLADGTLVVQEEPVVEEVQ